MKWSELNTTYLADTDLCSAPIDPYWSHISFLHLKDITDPSSEFAHFCSFTFPYFSHFLTLRNRNLISHIYHSGYQVGPITSYNKYYIGRLHIQVSINIASVGCINISLMLGEHCWFFGNRLNSVSTANSVKTDFPSHILRRPTELGKDCELGIAFWSAR